MSLVLGDEGRVGVRNDYPLVGWPLRAVLPVNIPDPVAAVLEENMRLEEAVPGAGAPERLPSPGNAVVVAVVPQLVEGCALGGHLKQAMPDDLMGRPPSDDRIVEFPDRLAECPCCSCLAPVQWSESGIPRGAAHRSCSTSRSQGLWSGCSPGTPSACGKPPRGCRLRSLRR